MSTRPSRAKAVRDRCYDCSGYDRKEVRECNRTECPLWQFRNAKSTTEKKKGVSRAKAVQQYCLDCCNGSATERDRCPSEDCPLWNFRNARAIKESGESAN